MYLFVAEFFPECGEEMPEFRGGDETVAVLVKVAEAFHEVLRGVRATPAANSLK